MMYGSTGGMLQIDVTTKDNQKIGFMYEYGRNDGCFIGDKATKLDKEFSKFLSGEDIINFLSSNIDILDIILNKSDSAKSFVQFIKECDFTLLKSIDICESVDFDEEPKHTEFNYEYKFGKNCSKPSISFVTHDEVGPSLNMKVCFYGDFALGNENGNYAKIKKASDDRKWIFHSLFVNNFTDDWKVYDIKNNYRFLIVGDITAEKIMAGEIDDYMQEAIKLQKKYKFDFITEKEFFALGDCNPPFADTEIIPSLVGKYVLCFGSFQKELVNGCDKGCMFEQLIKAGAIPVDCRYIEEQDYRVYDCDYIVIGQISLDSLYFDDLLSEDYFMHLDNNKRPPVFTQKDLTEKINDLCSCESQKENFDCSDKTFILTGMKPSEKKRIESLIVQNGGTVVSFALSANKIADYVVFGSMTAVVNKAIVMHLEGYEIELITLNQLFRNIE